MSSMSSLFRYLYLKKNKVMKKNSQKGIIVLVTIFGPNYSLNLQRLKCVNFTAVDNKTNQVI